MTPALLVLLPSFHTLVGNTGARLEVPHRSNGELKSSGQSARSGPNGGVAHARGSPEASLMPETVCDVIDDYSTVISSN